MNFLKFVSILVMPGPTRDNRLANCSLLNLEYRSKRSVWKLGSRTSMNSPKVFLDIKIGWTHNLFFYLLVSSSTWLALKPIFFRCNDRYINTIKRSVGKNAPVSLSNWRSAQHLGTVFFNQNRLLSHWTRQDFVTALSAWSAKDLHLYAPYRTVDSGKNAFGVNVTLVWRCWVLCA